MSTKNQLVSIIMPAYNAELYITASIQSVINQIHTHWELLVVNDGSKDATEAKVLAFQDHRIRYFKQPNKGVGAARNLALQNMKGDFFCFLDADDVMPPKSISSRLGVFEKHADIDFVDGAVLYKDSQLKSTLKIYKPSFTGFPYKKLLKLSDDCLFGNTWLVKREPGKTYLFEEDMTHSEDLFFYLSITANGKKYDYTNEEILYYRKTDSSAMTNLKGLEDGYLKFYKKLKMRYSISLADLLLLKIKIIKIMILSYLFNGKSFKDAVRVPFRYIFA